MMENELNIEVIKRTQEALGKYVKKPALSDKLLKKPPFRFLFDVINVVIKETGYFEGLYTSEELNFENIKDRDDKMRFLQKMIDVIKLMTNAPLKVRTSKIVSGHEVENTNQLLTMIGEVIDKKLDWKIAVQQVNNIKNSPPKPVEKKREILNSKEKVKEKERNTLKVAKTSPTAAKDTKMKKDLKDKIESKYKEKEKDKPRRSGKDMIDKGKIVVKKSLKTTKSQNQSTDHSSTQESSLNKKTEIKQNIPDNVEKPRVNMNLEKGEITPDTKNINESESRKSSSKSERSESSQKDIKDQLNSEEKFLNEINNSGSINTIVDNKESNLNSTPSNTVTTLPDDKKPPKTSEIISLTKKPSEDSSTIVKRESTFTAPIA